MKEFLVKNNAEHIKVISDQIQASTKVATEAILQLKISNTEKLNEKRARPKQNANRIKRLKTKA